LRLGVIAVNLLKLIMALMWPCNGIGIATVWCMAVGSAPVGSMYTEWMYFDEFGLTFY